MPKTYCKQSIFIVESVKPYILANALIICMDSSASGKLVYFCPDALSVQTYNAQLLFVQTKLGDKGIQSSFFIKAQWSALTIINIYKGNIRDSYKNKFQFDKDRNCDMAWNLPSD